MHLSFISVPSPRPFLLRPATATPFVVGSNNPIDAGCGPARCFPSHADDRCVRHARSHRSLSDIVSSSLERDVDLSPVDTGKRGLLPSVLGLVLDGDGERQKRRVVSLVRQPLQLDFAVAMMRGGYNAVDTLDFVAMDRFQKEFFDVRSREWESYLVTNNGVRQGTINDPRYFDFISYAQMRTIHGLLRNSADLPVVFEEPYQVEEGQSGFQMRVVKRDTALYPTPVTLLTAWSHLVGHSLLQYIAAKRNDSNAAALPTDRFDNGLKIIYDAFQQAGFCLAVYWSSDKDSTSTTSNAKRNIGTVQLVGPCILWGNQVLRKTRSIPNDYDCMCVQAYAKQCGVSVDYSTSFSQSSIFRSWSYV